MTRVTKAQVIARVTKAQVMTTSKAQVIARVTKAQVMTTLTAQVMTTLTAQVITASSIAHMKTAISLIVDGKKIPPLSFTTHIIFSNLKSF